MTGDAEAAGEPEIAAQVAYPHRIAPGDGREEHLQLGIGQRSFFFLQRHGRQSFGLPPRAKKALVIKTLDDVPFQAGDTVMDRR